MEKKESKEEIKFLGNKRKLDDNNLEQKEKNNNADKLLEQEEKNIFNILDSKIEDKNPEKHIITEEIEANICSKCGIKNKLISFGQFEDIYNYLLSNNINKKEELIKILKEKFKNIEFFKEKTICENCINNLLTEDIDIIIKFFSEEKEISKYNNLMNEYNINKNIPLNEDLDEKLENNNILNNKEKKENIPHITNNTGNLENANKININNIRIKHILI